MSAEFLMGFCFRHSFVRNLCALKSLNFWVYVFELDVYSVYITMETCVLLSYSILNSDDIVEF